MIGHSPRVASPLALHVVQSILNSGSLPDVRDFMHASTEPREAQEARECSRGWARRCAESKGRNCTCKCGGHNHGRANNTNTFTSQCRDDDSGEEAPEFQELGERAISNTPKCRSCGTELSGIVRGYPHDGGWTVPGKPGKWWLYIHCDGCGYDWALWKLGVPRV